MEANPLKGASLILGNDALAPHGARSAVVVLDNYELTDESIARDFELLPVESSRVQGPVRAQFATIRAFAKRNKQRFTLVRWKNGIECILCFDQGLPYPRPEQLIRAYKNAFAARALLMPENGRAGG